MLSKERSSTVQKRGLPMTRVGGNTRRCAGKTLASTNHHKHLAPLSHPSPGRPRAYPNRPLNVRLFGSLPSPKHQLCRSWIQAGLLRRPKILQRLLLSPHLFSPLHLGQVILKACQQCHPLIQACRLLPLGMGIPFGFLGAFQRTKQVFDSVASTKHVGDAILDPSKSYAPSGIPWFPWESIQASLRIPRKHMAFLPDGAADGCSQGARDIDRR